MLPLRILPALLRRFTRDRRANVAMMFGLSLVPLLVATGAGVDFARGVMVHQRMMQALDAAALAVGNATSKPSACSSTGNAASRDACAALRKLAQDYFNQNYDSSGNDSYGAPSDVDITIDGQAVTLTSTLQLKLTLLGMDTPLFDAVTPTVRASSTVVWGQTKLWVALVLDNSGSMAQGDWSGSKMNALKDAITNDEYGLLKTLQAAAANDGDVVVGIVPFTRSVNMGLSYNDRAIDWGEWEAPPANAGTLSSNLGPGGDCPWSTYSEGYRCTTGRANGASTTDRIPSSGLICPGMDNGRVNSAQRSRYYNGCFTSEPSGTTEDRDTDTETVCRNSSSCTTRNYCSGYPRSRTDSSGNVSTVTTTTCECTASGSDDGGGRGGRGGRGGGGSSASCTRTSTTVTTTTRYTHTWEPNSRSSWSGCVMDRQRRNEQTRISGGTGWRTPAAHDYDASSTAPSNDSGGDDTQFPAENPASCLSGTVLPLTANWRTLEDHVDDMQSNGATNQGIGVAHGFQMLDTASPYPQPAFRDGTSKVMILFSDGLNTQNRWWGNGSSEGTTETGWIDDRMAMTCAAAKNAGIVIYSIYVHIGSNGSSDALEDCASGADRYYDLTSSAQIKDAFSDIAQKITNLRVSQ